MTHHQDIASALGRELWTTDSFVPRYRSGVMGSWRIHPGGNLVSDWGYWSGPCLMEMLPSLARKVHTPSEAGQEGWETWMSLTPLEIESQELGYLNATGHVAIMGLGMGWIAANAALCAEVTRVTVVERDPEVVSLFHRSGAFDSIPEQGRRKIEIVLDDALTWRPEPEAAVDFLYADIWLQLMEPGALGQVRQMQDNVQSRTLYFWGQELAIYAAIQRDAGDNAAISEDAIQSAVADIIRLPLLVPDERDYATMIDQVVRNRIERRPPLDLSAIL